MVPFFEISSKLFCCPCCRSEELQWEFSRSTRSGLESGRLVCWSCEKTFFLEDGILDFLGEENHEEVITPFQRLMQFPPVTAIYKKFWRPLGFFIASSSSFRDFSKTLIDLLNPSEQRFVLDLACGPGLLTNLLAKNTAGGVIGFDLSRPMLRQARQLLLSEGTANTLLVRGSAFRLPFRYGLFDAILCSGALHLFDRPDLALQEISRTLSEKGKLICQTTIRPRHSLGVSTFLERVIRFGFFKSKGELHAQLDAVGLRIEYEWSRRLIYLFLALKM